MGIDREIDPQICKLKITKFSFPNHKNNIYQPEDNILAEYDMASLENQRLGIQCLWQKELSLPGLQFDADVVYSYLDFFVSLRDLADFFT